MNTLNNPRLKALAGLSILSGILYLSLIFNNNLWVDEAFTACIIRGSFPEVWEKTLSDTLPPFYNVAGWVFTSLFGYSSYTLKLFSVLPMLLLLVLNAVVIRRLAGETAALIAALFLSAMPHLLHYGVEIRMYSWALFFLSGAAAAALIALRPEKKSGVPLLALFTVLCGYTHHFALVSAAFLWLLVFCLLPKNRKTLGKIMAGASAVLVLYLPCLFITVKQLRAAGDYFSMSPLTFSSFLSDFRFPFVTDVTCLSALLLLCFLSLVFFGIRFLGKASLPYFALLSLFPLTLLFGYAVSLSLSRTFFTARYLVPSLGPFWLGAAALAAGEAEYLLQNRGKAGRLLTVFFFLVFVSVLSVDYVRQFREEYIPDAGIMTDFLADSLSEEDGYLIYEDNYQIEICMRYYAPELEKTDWNHAKDIQGTLWFFEVPGFEEHLAEAAAHGYRADFVSDFSFDRYSFSLYRLEKEK